VLKQPNQQVLSALAAVNVDSRFEIVKRWLKESLDGLDADNRITKDDVVVRWNQGGAQVLNELLTKLESASDALRKSR